MNTVSIVLFIAILLYSYFFVYRVLVENNMMTLAYEVAPIFILCALGIGAGIYGAL